MAVKSARILAAVGWDALTMALEYMPARMSVSATSRAWRVKNPAWFKNG